MLGIVLAGTSYSVEESIKVQKNEHMITLHNETQKTISGTVGFKWGDLHCYGTPGLTGNISGSTKYIDFSITAKTSKSFYLKDILYGCEYFIGKNKTQYQSFMDSIRQINVMQSDDVTEKEAETLSYPSGDLYNVLKENVLLPLGSEYTFSL